MNVSSSQAKTVLELRTHMACHAPRKAALVAAGIIAAAFLVLVSLKNPLLAGATVLLLVSATSEFLLPIRYRFTPQGVEMRNFLTFRVIRWDQVQRCYRGPQGIKISPLTHRGRREAFRGIQVWVEGEEQDRIVETILSLWHRPEETV